MDVGETLSERISDGLEAAVRKYFDRSFDASVTVEKRGHEVVVECNVHLPSGIVLQSSGQASDPYVSLEDSLEKMEKRVRRYHRKLKDHNKQRPFPSEPATAFIIRSAEDGTDEKDDIGEASLIIAESASDVKTMSVSEAVLQLEVSEATAVLFRNVKHAGLNMVYRRDDGNIGWVDPAGHSATA